MTTDQILIPRESPEEFAALRAGFFQEHKPCTHTETLLVESLAQHQWFIQRAIGLQNAALAAPQLDEKRLGLLLRYQSAHERSFQRCLTTLLKFLAQMAKELIGFESQKQKDALTEAKIRSLDAKTEATKIDSEIRTTIEAPLPGHLRIPFDTMKPVVSAAVRALVQHAGEPGQKAA